jgi:hypothetical protein
MKKVFFHIGLPKTGTSYLQNIFAINSVNYRKHGLIYENFSNNFDQSKLDKITSGNGINIAQSLRTNLNTTLNLLNKLDKNYDHLISSEDFINCNLDCFKNILNIFDKNFEVVFIAFVRNPAEHLISSYLQSIKSHGNKNTFPNWLTVNGKLKLKKNLNLLISLRPFIKILNYDFKKNDLINCFDSLIFHKLISALPEKKIINPSPNYHQSEILRLLNNLEIKPDLQEAAQYIESENSKEKKKFSISKLMFDEIYNYLSEEIKEINTMLPENEQIIKTYDNCVDIEFQSLFTNNDIDFLKRKIINTISDDKRLLLNKKLSHYSLSSELPEDFDVLNYLLLNPDVLRLNIDPVKHYLRHGKKENRVYKSKKMIPNTNLHFDSSKISIIKKILKLLFFKLK